MITLPSLDRGDYQIRIVRKSDNFDSSDRFRVGIDVERPGSLIFTDHTSGGEMQPPADDPSVFAVGEKTDVSSVGPTADGRTKPDAILEDATVSFTDGTETRGSSNASAILTGAVALMKASCPSLDFTALEAYASSLRTAASPSDLRPASSGVSPAVRSLVPEGGTLWVQTNGHFVILTPGDPLELPIFKAYGAYRIHPDDILTISPLENRWYGFPRAQAALIRSPLVEFRQLESGGLWKSPTPAGICTSTR
jgi:hypothetical protein